MTTRERGRSFRCPECGSRRCSARIHRDPAWTFGHGKPNGPWDMVLQALVCADCHFMIPAHLAERWNAPTAADATHEWQEIYKPGAGRDAPSIAGGGGAVIVTGAPAEAGAPAWEALIKSLGKDLRGRRRTKPSPRPRRRERSRP